ncbi:MAG: lipoprotein [Methylophaga sp.]|nr:lipoprotein [Methylophaga sp.]
MNKITTWKRVATVVCLVLLTTACGQKGDLYLPEGNALVNWLG